jgi:uncharacterized protein YsxB (DUF464 family)
LVKNKRSHIITSSGSPDSESITEVSRRRKDSYFDSPLMESPSMVKLIKKPDYFAHTREGYEKARPSTPTRIIKCSLIKECILWLQSKNLRIFNPYEKGKGEYCKPRNLPTITLEKLKLIKHPCFLLLQEMFFYKGILMIDAYLHGILETTLKSYRSGWKIFIYFLVEENNNNSDWEDKNLCQEIYLEFLNRAFIGKEVAPTSLNIVCSAISKFLTVFIPDFNFAQSNFVKNIKKGVIKDKPKNLRYSNIWNPDILLNYYQQVNLKRES